MDDEEIDPADGQWYAMTTGQFIELLVDSGYDPAVIFRVKSDGPRIVDGDFVRLFEFYLIPDRMIKLMIDAVDPRAIHKVLSGMLKAGLLT